MIAPLKCCKNAEGATLDWVQGDYCCVGLLRITDQLTKSGYPACSEGGDNV